MLGESENPVMGRVSWREVPGGGGVETLESSEAREDRMPCSGPGGGYGGWRGEGSSTAPLIPYSCQVSAHPTQCSFS